MTINRKKKGKTPKNDNIALLSSVPRVFCSRLLQEVLYIAVKKKGFILNVVKTEKSLSKIIFIFLNSVNC